MSVPKIETDKFDDKYDFVMWRRKMKAVSVQNKILPEVLCVCVSPSCSQVVDHWVLDSGCTFLMTPNKHWFSDFKPLNQGKVYIGNNQDCDVKCIGNIFIKMHDGMTRKLTEVRYVPDLRRNLISLSYLDFFGLSFKSKNGILRICKGNLVMLKGFRRDSLYILIGKIVCNSTALISKTVPEKTIDKIDSLDFCDHCVLGKQHKLSFSTSTHKSFAILDYVHYDLWDLKRFQLMVTNLEISIFIMLRMLSNFIPKLFHPPSLKTSIVNKLNIG
ncbi:hypothetical protein M9H77_08708 [Catharanthus roseus]|uniref:Uncharacterized protein n=1 Tax=Catharanthus roseus TaxID=4058 RepID=A0ACC0BYZ7_CATRO|nr:hypothetical protein M9H77_08708 [Catharanthus roseus]